MKPEHRSIKLASQLTEQIEAMRKDAADFDNNKVRIIIEFPENANEPERLDYIRGIETEIKELIYFHLED